MYVPISFSFLVFIDLGGSSSDSATLAFSFDTSALGAVTRQYEIKVTQLACNAFGPPTGCLQWHEGIAGQLTTFNFIPTADNHLALQEYVYAQKMPINTLRLCILHIFFILQLFHLYPSGAGLLLCWVQCLCWYWLFHLGHNYWCKESCNWHTLYSGLY